MTRDEQLSEFARSVGIFRARDLAEQGIPRWTLAPLCQSGELVRVGRGLYRHVDHEPTENLTLAEASKRVPKGVVCLLSALRFHELTTQLPHEVWMALPDRNPPKVEYPVIRFHFFSKEAYEAGISMEKLDGVDVRIYNPAKTVVDCFKYRNKIGIDVAIESLRDALRQKMATSDDLWNYSKVCRMTKVMRPYMEAAF